MKKLFFILLSLWILNISTISYGAITSSTVKIFSIGQEGFGGCTGVIIKKDSSITTVLTAKHCIDVHEEMYVEDRQAQLIIASKEDDLALLVIKGSLVGKEVAKIAENIQLLEDTAYFVGYPTEELYIQSGTLKRVTKDWVFYNIVSRPGCSGGGLFNTNNELVGILWGEWSSQKSSIAEPLKDIKRFLKETKMYLPLLNDSLNNYECM